MVTIGYLGAIVLGPLVPLVVYVLGGRRSPFLRYHTATALNLSLTGLLYVVCCFIVAGLLLLDSLTVALVVAGTAALVLWLVMVRYLVRGVAAANRGELGEVVPGWICARIAR
jgi:uncharacterized Tic20 family protein